MAQTIYSQKKEAVMIFDSIQTEKTTKISRSFTGLCVFFQSSLRAGFPLPGLS